MKQTAILFLLLPIYAGAQVRYGYQGDTLKGNIKQMTEEGSRLFLTPAKIVYTCDPAAKIETIAGYSKGSLPCDKIVLQFDGVGRITEKTVLGDSNKPEQWVIYQYDAQGREIYERSTQYPYNGGHCDEGGDGDYIVLSDTSVEEKQYRRDTAGRILEEKHRTISNQRLTGRRETHTSLITTAYSYDGAGRVTEKKIELQKAAPGIPSSQTTTYVYDAAGRKTVEYHLSEGGDTTFLLPFYCDGRMVTLKETYRYDDMDNVVEEHTQMMDRQRRFRRHPGIRTGTTKLCTFDNHHHMTSYIQYKTYLNDDGTLRTADTVSRQLPPDTYIRKQEYDSHGNKVKETKGNEVIFSREIAYY